MLTYRITVTYSSGSEVIDTEAKDSLEAVEKAAKHLRRKQRITGNYRTVVGMEIRAVHISEQMGESD